MERQTKRTWAEISLSNLEHNVNQLRSRLPAGCRYLGVVKANAYGHGAVPIARKLQEIGVEHLAVASFDEAAELREAGITAQILILGPSPAWLAKDIAALGNVVQAVGSLYLAEALSEAIGEGTLPVHLKLDTGMSRTGFPVHLPHGLGDAERAMALKGLDVQGIFTHFALLYHTLALGSSGFAQIIFLFFVRFCMVRLDRGGGGVV